MHADGLHVRGLRFNSCSCVGRLCSNLRAASSSPSNFKCRGLQILSSSLGVAGHTDVWGRWRKVEVLPLVVASKARVLSLRTYHR